MHVDIMKYRVLSEGEFVGYINFDPYWEQYVFSNALLSPHPDLSLKCKYFGTVSEYSMWLDYEFEDYTLEER